ncbi:hypothetical protein [Archangium sp.]|uniref:hypothetical protein n=1 Tax=Archangium sp. TaxID=1872627 RepID=UPI00286BF513|nr:hypothetical protein [Archangium sp.]
MSTTEDLGRNEVKQPPVRLPNEAVQPSRPVDVTIRDSSRRDVFLYVLFIGLIAFLLGATGWYASTVVATYQQMLASAKETSEPFLLSIARAQSIDLTKGCVLMFCFLLVLLGTLLVILKNVEGSSFRLGVHYAKTRSELRTSSPGLVLVTLGLAVAALMIRTQSRVDLQVTPSNAPSEAPASTPPPKSHNQTLGSSTSSQSSETWFYGTNWDQYRRLFHPPELLVRPGYPLSPPDEVGMITAPRSANTPASNKR